MQLEKFKTLVHRAYDHVEQPLYLEKARDPQAYFSQYGRGHGHAAVMAEMYQKITNTWLPRNKEKVEADDFSGLDIFVRQLASRQLIRSTRLEAQNNLLQLFYNEIKVELKKQHIELPSIDLLQLKNQMERA